MLTANQKSELLKFTSGKIICLHIPYGFEESDKTLENELMHLATHQGKRAAIARPAEVKPSGGTHSLKQSNLCWLSIVGGVSEKESKQISARLGLRIAEGLASNSGTQRCLLGLAAALFHKPQVLIYSTAALDVEGIRIVHRFIASICSQLSIVHISYPSVFGDGTPHPRICPPAAECLELTGDGANVA